MLRTSLLLPVFFTLVAACSSSSSPATANGTDQDAGPHDSGDAAVAHDAAPDAVVDAGPIFDGSATAHGTIVDYFTLKPVPGLTVTDNGLTSKTDAMGKWSITEPAGATLLPTVTGPSYSNLLFPESLPAAADVDFAASVMPNSSTYMLEQQGLTSDPSKALVQAVIVTKPSCASVVGGTLAVLAPSGAKVVYFATSGLPDQTVKSFQGVTPPRPVAVVFDIAVGAELSLQVSHPTCKQVPFPYTYQGKIYTGKVPTKAAEPGDNNAAIVLEME